MSTSQQYQAQKPGTALIITFLVRFVEIPTGAGVVNRRGSANRACDAAGPAEDRRFNSLFHIEIILPSMAYESCGPVVHGQQ